ncbi:PIN domain-containing protein [bacterium]|nr:PIN domain-containing protein [bacterium]
MNDVLVDTSAWISAMRGDNSNVRMAVDKLLAKRKAVFCGVVELELLRGMRPNEKRLLLPLLRELPFLEIDREDWQSAGELLNRLRSQGKTIPSNDALVAVLCLRHQMELLTLDKHFNYVPALKRFRISARRSS